MTLDLSGQVAIVTGAGHGLGRSHALGLAAHGARVVVNDFGGARDGTGGSSAAAERVAAEIEQAGGQALANDADVTELAEVEAMAAAALECWGRIDILVNNAGILRDKTFAKVTMEDFWKVVDVHFRGSVHCTRAVWASMCEAGYGRVVMTTSSTGLFGNFGQASYGAAKMAVVGLMNTLALEGAKYDVRINTLAPCAATRMTEDLLPQPVLDLIAPEKVTAGLLHLVGPDAPTRTILSAGAGVFSRVQIRESPGVFLAGDDCSAEGVAEHWEAIAGGEPVEEPANGPAETRLLLETAARQLGIDFG